MLTPRWHGMRLIEIKAESQIPAYHSIAKATSDAFARYWRKKTMDKDRVAGSAKVVKGKVKQALGKAVGDAKLESEGKQDRGQSSERHRRPQGHAQRGNKDVAARIFLTIRSPWLQNASHDLSRTSRPPSKRAPREVPNQCRDLLRPRLNGCSDLPFCQ